MKKKIIKLWGIGMIFVLLTSLLVVGATPAAAADLSWSTVFVPGGFNQIAPNTDVAVVRVAPNGDIYATDPANATGAAVYKSTDGGRTWGVAPIVLGVAGDLVADIQISPSYETDSTVVVLVNTAAGPTVVYISENAGLTYTTLGTNVHATQVGTSLAISPVYNGGGEIMVGTYNAGVGFGDVYIWGQPGFSYVWNPQALGEDVTAVAFSPNYALDFTIIAVGSTAANTFVHTKVGTSAWDATVGTGVPVTITTVTGAITEFDGAALTEIVSAALAFPSDFRASLYPTNTICYLAVRSEQTDDKIYRVSCGGGATGSVRMDPNAAPGFPIGTDDDEVTSLAYAGTGATGTLYIGYAGVAGALNAAVYRSSTAGTATPTYAAANPAPTGTLGAAGQLTYVAVAADYATSNRVYAGTGNTAANPVTNSALSVSDNGGASFYQAGLIDTPAAYTIDDLQSASANEHFLVTNDGGGGVESIWKTADGGATWYRYGSVATTTAGIIRLSPTYATDHFVMFGDVGSGAAGNIMTSNDGGITWLPANAPVTITDIAIRDAFTYYVASAGGVDMTVNGGWTWQIGGATASAGNVFDLEYDPASGHLLVGTLGATGTVLLSTDNNLTYVQQGAAVVTAVGTTAMTVAFDSGYSTNNMIYAADTDAIASAGGLFRYDTTAAPGTAWTAIDAGATGLPVEIISAPDGTLYASDATVGGGIQRSLNPTAPAGILFEGVNGGVANDALPATAALGVMSLVEGSNIIFAVDNAAVGILTYTDTLTQAVPVIVSPSDGDIVLAGAASVSITPIPGNDVFGTYVVQWNTRADWLGAGVPAIPIPGVINAVNLNAGPDGLLGTADDVPLPTGTTIYIRVRATGTVFSPWTDAVSIETQLTTGAINAPGIIPPVGGSGNTGPGGFNTALNPTFNWGPIGGATNYEFQLAMDASFTDPIIDYTGGDALGNVLVYQLTTMTLDYNTTYYWRVKGISATSETEWSAAVGFTTMSEPVETEPPVTVTNAPDITVQLPDQPTPTTVTFEPAPVEETAQGYIWAIIIIGAVLVIAVIVLIVRTRRSV